jgi:hypothetical protein
VIEETVGELDEHEGDTMVNGPGKNPPKETFLRQDTYTVTSRQDLLARQDTYILEARENGDYNQEEDGMKEDEQQSVTKATDEAVNDSLETSRDIPFEYSQEPIYKEAYGEEEDEEDLVERKVDKGEDKYVTAEEVRIQKHSIEKKLSGSTSVSTTTATSITVVRKEAVSRTDELVSKNIEQFSEELASASLPLAVAVAARSGPVEDEGEQEEVEELERSLMKKEVSGEEATRRSRDVDQLCEAIRDPELDCSMEDIAAMVEVRLGGWRTGDPPCRAASWRRQRRSS